jgi:hypothetical protein
MCATVTTCSYAQEMEARPFQAPVPGTDTPSTPLPPTAPPATTTSPDTSTSTTESAGSAPLPGTSSTQSLPPRLTSVISLHDAQVWADRFKEQTANASPQLLDQLATFYEWLLELLDEHNRLSSIFAKNENTKSMADTEKQTVAKFNHLKIQVLLLKAELLIKLNRYAEAIMPLVEIVNAEPLSAAGKEAYKDLQDIGFSEIPAFTSLLPDGSEALRANIPETTIAPPQYRARTIKRTTAIKASPTKTSATKTSTKRISSKAKYTATSRAKRSKYTAYRFH